jgi:hypothetical protein
VIQQRSFVSSPRQCGCGTTEGTFFRVAISGCSFWLGFNSELLLNDPQDALVELLGFAGDVLCDSSSDPAFDKALEEVFAL